MAARTVPVLREAGASWYYEVSAAAGAEDGGSSSSSSQVKGPISARELSRLLEVANDNNDVGDVGTGSDDVIDGLTRVWSSDIAPVASTSLSTDDGESSSPQEQQWMSISELPFLRLALEAFEGSHPTWAINETAASSMMMKDKNGQKQQEGNGSNVDDQLQTYDESAMTYDAGSSGGADHADSKAHVTAGADKEKEEGLSKQEADDLEAFLNSTAQAGDDDADGAGGNDEEEEEEYESDGGTRYVRDAQSGGWIHEDLAPQKKTSAVGSSDRTVHHANRGPPSDTKSEGGASTTNSAGANNKTTAAGGVALNVAGRKRKKKGKFSAKNAKCWVYVTGLPYDTDEDELAKYFGRVGVLDLDPETQHPKIKLYRRRKGDSTGPEGSLKGDASICYARAESVDLALQFLDDSFLRPDSKEKLSVQRAKFEQHGDKFEDRGRISNAKRKVAKLAALQAVGWDEGENGRITGGKKGLCIIVLKGMFDLVELKNEGEDKVLSALEQEIREECEPLGDLEKITAFSKNPEGVIVIKFGQPTAASDAIAKYHGTMRRGRRIDASFWDGVTDYTVRDEEKETKEETKRLDDFGKFLDNQDLPEEFRLNVEG